MAELRFEHRKLTPEPILVPITVYYYEHSSLTYQSNMTYAFMFICAHIPLIYHNESIAINDFALLI